jgi:ATP diphosphatase
MSSEKEFSKTLSSKALSSKTVSSKTGPSKTGPSEKLPSEGGAIENSEAAERYDFQDLINLLAYLRDPDFGCPWDIVQTPETIVPYTIEEVYEVVEAIELKDWSGLGEELGDLLLQVVFYAQMARERGHFDLHDVVDRLVKKMVRRHPHVFPQGELAPPAAATQKAATTQQVKKTWESIKQQERAEKDADNGKAAGKATPQTDVTFPLAESLAAIPKELDALASAQKLQVKAARFGLDWTASTDVFQNGLWSQLLSEITELEEALQQAASEQTAGAARAEQAMEDSMQSAVAAELGDVIFTCVNLARHLKLDAAQCLRHSNRTFGHRAVKVERLALVNSPTADLSELSAEQLDLLWQQAKGKAR